MKILFIVIFLFSFNYESVAACMKVTSSYMHKEKKKKTKVKKKKGFNAYYKKSNDVGVFSEENTKIKSNNMLNDNVITKDLQISRGYEKQRLLADSIRNTNKNWLDSTLAVLPKKKQVVIHENDEIEIFITGGGLYTGVNPTTYDRLTIYNSGLVYRQSKTKLQDETITKNKISKDNLRKLAQFIIDEDFYDFNNLYDCDAKDKTCNERLKSQPEPVPLTVVVAIGMRRKNIYTALYAPGMESNWVNYPANLEKIVNAIYDAAVK